MVHHPPGFLVAQIVVTELVRCGVRHFCVCPGSRSTSLALGAWLESTCELSVHHDERCAGFFALGKAMVTRRPVALITTSGTAVAELLPAVVEACQSQIPLILLTADRPAGLRGTGSNQTIMQPGIFGLYVKSKLDVPVFTSAELERTADDLKREVATLYAQGTDIRPGPVHCNIQFDKPFEPAGMTPYAAIEPEMSWPRLGPEGNRWHKEDLEVAAQLLAPSDRGLIIVGPNRYPAAFATAVLKLARTLGFPILADPLSGLRHADPGHAFVIASYEALLQADLLDDLTCDLVLRFGSLPVSLRLIQYMETHLDPNGPHIYVNASRQIHDESGAVTHYLASAPMALCRQLADRLPERRLLTPWRQRWQELDRGVMAAMREMDASPAWDGAYVTRLLEALPSPCTLFAGNSLPIRILDLVGHAPWLTCRVYGNRGASGIDGLVSTALGIAHSTQASVCLLIGDLSLLHDIGGLAAIRRLAIHNVVVVVLNNQGGGIFERLPVSQLGPAFEELFIVPHETSFACLAEAFGLPYRMADSPAHLAELASRVFATSCAHLIEVVTGRKEDLGQADQFIQLVKERCTRGNSEPRAD